MDHIHYSFAPLILFRVLYTLDLLPYYLSIANGAGGVGILNLTHFNVSIEAIVLYILMYYYTGILFVVLRERVGFVHKFICRKPAVPCMNDQRLTNLYGSLKPQTGSFNR